MTSHVDYQATLPGSYTWDVTALKDAKKHPVLDVLPLERLPILVAQRSYHLNLVGFAPHGSPLLMRPVSCYFQSTGSVQGELRLENIQEKRWPSLIRITADIQTASFKPGQEWMLMVDHKPVLKAICLVASPTEFAKWLWENDRHPGTFHPRIPALCHRLPYETMLWKQLLKAINRWFKNDPSFLSHSIPDGHNYQAPSPRFLATAEPMPPSSADQFTPERHVTEAEVQSSTQSDALAPLGQFFRADGPRLDNFWSTNDCLQEQEPFSLWTEELSIEEYITNDEIQALIQSSSVDASQTT